MSQGGGLLFDLSKRAMATGNTTELDEAIRSKIRPYLYNDGDGKWIHCAHLACLRNRDRPKSKQFEEIKVRLQVLTFAHNFTMTRPWAMVLSTSSSRGVSCWPR